MKSAPFALLVMLAACGAATPRVNLDDKAWPARIGDYEEVTQKWTRTANMRSTYQEALEVSATFKSNEWRAADAAKDANARGLVGEARAQRMAQAQADAAGPYEFELMVTTWDRRENDLDRGKRSVWRLRMLDENGMEIEPLEVIKDKRPGFIIRSEFPVFGDFAEAYIVRFPRNKPLLGPGVKQMRMRMSSTRGGVELVWKARGA
jgi:hypothetical protein